jgi:ATP-binding cassette subfamily B (MDR/TAP) protein 1
MVGAHDRRVNNLIAPFLAFLYFFSLLMSSEAESMTNDLSKGSNAMRAVFAILDRKSEIDPNNSLGTSNIKRKLNIQVELNNVFAYPTRPDQMIFNVLNLKIDAGKTVALVGPSGSGKYTIIGLVERFYDSLNGAVFIDLQEITSFNLRTLGSHIALVSQEQHCLLELSVKILPMVEDARESEMRKAAVLATAQEFIRYIAVEKIKTPTQPCSYE